MYSFFLNNYYLTRSSSNCESSTIYVGNHIIDTLSILFEFTLNLFFIFIYFLFSSIFFLSMFSFPCVFPQIFQDP